MDVGRERLVVTTVSSVIASLGTLTLNVCSGCAMSGSVPPMMPRNSRASSSSTIPNPGIAVSSTGNHRPSCRPSSMESNPLVFEE